MMTLHLQNLIGILVMFKMRFYQMLLQALKSIETVVKAG
jgi:hypothetical protein